MTELSELLKNRMESQGMTKYQIAKRLAQIDGQGKPATNYSNLVYKILESPENRVFQGLKNLIEILGGEVVIRWRDTTEHPLK